MKYVKFIAGLLLLPLLASSLIALAGTIQGASSNDLFWVPFIGGVICFAITLAWLPKPMWLYVVGHELTHVLWTWLFGGSVKKFRATRKGGHVIVTKSNFLISLAPYFFPLYSIVAIACYASIRPWIDTTIASPIFHCSLGFTIAFHLFMNLEVLKTRQPDWADHGYFFSGVVVITMNSWVFGSGIALLRGMEGFSLHWKAVASEFWKLVQLAWVR